MKHTQPIYHQLELIQQVKFAVSYWHALSDFQRENILDDLGW